MAALWQLLIAAIAVVMTCKGVAIATGRGRPQNLGGMLLAALGLALALMALAGLARSLPGR
jgi:hypothetical protein